MAFPGIRFSASSTTSASVESTRIGAGTRVATFSNIECDVALFVFAHDGAAQVEHVRAFGYQLLGERQNFVVLLAAHQVAEMLHPGGGVHLLRDY